MKEIKEHTAILTILFIGIGAFRILLLGEKYAISLWTFVSFSNILAYTFDVIRGLVYFIIPVMFFTSFKTRVLSWLLRAPFCCLFIIAVVLGVAGFIWYEYTPMSRWSSFGLKYDLLLSLFFGGVSLKKLDDGVGQRRSWISDFHMIKFIMLVAFLYCYVKIDFAYSLYNINDRKQHWRAQLIIKTASLPNASTLPGPPIVSKPKFDTINTTLTKYVILATADYVFLHDEIDNSTSAIAMSNIMYFTTNIKVTPGQ